MTKILGEAALALLAAGGLLMLGWLLFGRLLAPVGGRGAPVYAVVPVHGGGAALERTVDGLLWLQSGDFARFTIVVADFGLDESGLAAAAALARREPGVIFCSLGSLEEYIKDTIQDGCF